MRILICLGHPAHFHLFKNVIHKLKSDGKKVLIIIKKKDVLEKLLDTTNISYENILLEDKGDSKIGLAWSLLKRDYRMWKRVREFRPDVMLGPSAEIAHIGKLLKIPSLIFTEDDWDIVPYFAKLSYPFATNIIAPNGCRMGKWSGKTIRHNSFHELAYLHPDHFEPSKEKIRGFHKTDEPYFILRFVELNAHHDEGIQGIDNKKAHRLINLLSEKGKVYITSERKLTKSLEKYRVSINPIDIHHALKYATLFIGDSQTMAAESMVLGTPSIRYNDFVGKISYLEELENHYNLGFGIKPDEFDQLLDKATDLLNYQDLYKKWSSKRKLLLSEKINLTTFINNLLEEI